MGNKFVYGTQGFPQPHEEKFFVGWEPESKAKFEKLFKKYEQEAAKMSDVEYESITHQLFMALQLIVHGFEHNAKKLNYKGQGGQIWQYLVPAAITRNMLIHWAEEFIYAHRDSDSSFVKRVKRLILDWYSGCGTINDEWLPIVSAYVSSEGKEVPDYYEPGLTVKTPTSKEMAELIAKCRADDSSYSPASDDEELSRMEAAVVNFIVTQDQLQEQIQHFSPKPKEAKPVKSPKSVSFQFGSVNNPEEEESIPTGNKDETSLIPDEHKEAMRVVQLIESYREPGPGKIGILEFKFSKAMTMAAYYYYCEQVSKFVSLDDQEGNYLGDDFTDVAIANHWFKLKHEYPDKVFVDDFTCDDVSAVFRSDEASDEEEFHDLEDPSSEVQGLSRQFASTSVAKASEGQDEDSEDPDNEFDRTLKKVAKTGSMAQAFKTISKEDAKDGVDAIFGVSNNFAQEVLQASDIVKRINEALEKAPGEVSSSYLRFSSIEAGLSYLEAVGVDQSHLSAANAKWERSADGGYQVDYKVFMNAHALSINEGKMKAMSESVDDLVSVTGESVSAMKQTTIAVQDALPHLRDLADWISKKSGDAYSQSQVSRVLLHTLKWDVYLIEQGKPFFSKIQNADFGAAEQFLDGLIRLPGLSKEMICERMMDYFENL